MRPDAANLTPTAARPPSLDAARFAETWAAFRAVERTLGPTPGVIETWRRGRERYLVWALRVSDPRVTARMASVAGRLGDAVVPVRAEDAHVTTWVCGFPATAPTLDDDVGESIVAAQRAATTRLPPARLVVGAPSAFSTCAFLEVHDPHGDLAAMRAALAVPGALEIRFSRYQPHVTVGRFRDARAATPIAEALASLRRDRDAAPFAVDGCALELVALDARAPDRLTRRL
jgi:2'-5' RNA ligase